jgi:transcriptional regulator with XRE-family HTH domain
MGFAGWLRATRMSRVPTVSQEALAVAAGALEGGADGAADVRRARFSQARLSEWERGATLPDLRQFVVLGLALGLTDDEAREGRRLWDAEQLAGIPVTGVDHLPSST